MKRVLVPILMIQLLMQTFSSWLVIAEYKLNKDYIAKNLCVNKARPKMHCNGKCQMMKRLAEEEKQNSSNGTNNSVRTKIQEILFCDEIQKLTPSFPGGVTTCYNEEPPVPIPDIPVPSIFHPPIFG